MAKKKDIEKKKKTEELKANIKELEEEYRMKKEGGFEDGSICHILAGNDNLFYRA